MIAQMRCLTKHANCARNITKDGDTMVTYITYIMTKTTRHISSVPSVVCASL
jgi:hypothetical protein